MSELFMELWSFMRERKKFWLLPIILCLVLLGGLTVFSVTSGVRMITFCRAFHIQFYWGRILPTSLHESVDNAL